MSPDTSLPCLSSPRNVSAAAAALRETVSRLLLLRA